MNGVHSGVLRPDVESLRPAAMAVYDQPCGKMYRVNKRNKEELGAYFCKAEAHQQDFHELFPARYNNKVVHKCPIDIGKDEGHEVKVIHGYEWSQNQK